MSVWLYSPYLRAQVDHARLHQMCTLFVRIAKEYQEEIRRWERESKHGMNTHFCHLGWQPRYGNPHMWSVLVVCPRGIPLGEVNESSVLLHGLTFQIYPTKIASTLMIFLVPNDNNHKCKQWVKNLFLPRPKCTPEHQGVNRLSSDQIKHAMEWIRWASTTKP